LGTYRKSLVAAPAYLAANGVPLIPDDLKAHAENSHFSRFLDVYRAFSGATTWVPVLPLSKGSASAGARRREPRRDH
jgi:hypothetical protein